MEDRVQEQVDKINQQILDTQNLLLKTSNLVCKLQDQLNGLYEARGKYLAMRSTLKQLMEEKNG